jgi:LDH2 family malate/lactate/ureidoglycolate dehydrogenase
MTGDTEKMASSSDRPVTVQRTAAARWGEALLGALGAGPIPARETVDHLLAAEDAGHPSHGLRMLVSIAAAVRQGHIKPAAEPAVELSSGSVARINGRRSLGPPAGLLATAEAIKLAKTHGASAVAIREAGHMGRLAPYADAAADAGCATFICANDSGATQHVVPAGGLEGRLSTNPVAFGFPRAEPPHLIVDLATSAYAHGTLAALTEAGRPLPDDAFVAGRPDLMLPMAGHKGFALALIVEALAGALTGAGVVGEDPPAELQGALIVAVDIEALAPTVTVTGQLEEAIAWVRSAAPEAGQTIRIPGEHRVPGAGAEVVIPVRLWTQLVELTQELDVPPPPSRKDET